VHDIQCSVVQVMAKRCKQHAMHLVVVSMPVCVNEAVNYVHSHSIIQAMTSIVASAHRHSFGS